MRTLGYILGQIKGQKPSGPVARRVFCLWTGLGCGLRFALRKSLGGTFNLLPSEYIEYFRKRPMGLLSPCYLLAFPTDLETGNWKLWGGGHYGY